MNKFVEEYYELLTNEYSGINLTRITDYEEFKLKQISDSIEPFEQSQVFQESLEKTRVMVDVGFGGGFPILPLARHAGQYRYFGVETRAKKVKVVAEIAEKLGLKNTDFYHSRIEQIMIDIPVVCTFKAVGKVNDFLNKIYTTEIIQVFFYKGPNFYEIEYDQIKEAKKHWKIIEEKEINLPGVEKRILIGFENKQARKGLNNLVKLSELI